MTKYHPDISFFSTFAFYCCLIFTVGSLYYGQLPTFIVSVIGMCFFSLVMMWSGMTLRNFIGLEQK